MASRAAVQITEEVLSELDCRKGFRHILDGLDDETRLDLVDALHERVDAVLKKLLGY